MGKILNSADIESPDDLEGAKLKLEEISRLALNPTERVTDEFVVAKNRAFFESVYGNIVVYTIPDQRKIAEFHFEPNSIRDMTTDGERIYMRLMGYVEAKQEDILLAELENIFDPPSALKFVGKKIKELEFPQGDTRTVRTTPLDNRIVSFPIETVLLDAIIEDPVALTNQYTRVLCSGDHGFTVDMFSKDGYVECDYGVTTGPGCHGTFHLQDGELYTPDESVLQKTNQSLPERVCVFAVNRLDLRARFHHSDKDHEPGQGITTPLPIVFKGGGEYHSIPQAFILRENRWFDGKLYVLWNQKSREDGNITKVDKPHILIEYEATLEKD